MRTSKWKRVVASLGAAALIAGAIVLGGIAAVVVGGGVGGPGHAGIRASIEIPSTPPPSPWPKWSAEGGTSGSGHRVAVAVRPISCPPPDVAPGAPAVGGTVC